MVLPPGYLVAEDAAAGEQVRRTLAGAGCTLEPLADAAAARTRQLQDPQGIMVYVAGALPKPPYPPLEPLLNLGPRERRQFLLAVVADNVKSLDGNIAFLYGVDVLLNKQHLPQAAALIAGALAYRQQIYRPLLAALAD